MSGGGDYTRFTFDPADDHSGVWMQQGRVMLDADYNELAEIIDRRFRATTMDTIGRCTVPRETQEGFQIQLAGPTFTIGRGRLYADGLLAENHGGGDLEFDPSLGEQRGQDPVAYEDQPYLPNAAAAAPLPTSGGPFLVYVDVWRREVTYLEEPDLLEKAVGVDTATRLQTAWQVRVFEPTDRVPGLTCDTPDEDIPGWAEHIAPSAGRLTTEAVGIPDSDDPCEIPPNAGYRGTENRLYRVEIHDPGPEGTATFKWSRDNASVATAVTGLNVARDQLTVVRTRRDEVLRFSTDDWVEVSDDWHELHGVPGVMRKVLTVDDVAQTVTLTTALPAGEFDPVDATRHTRVRRWDHKGQVRDGTGTVIGDVDAMGGVIQVPAATTGILLEDGVQVTFSTDPAGGSFRVADHWAFAARTADASVEELVEAPPRAIHHHYCRLAVVDLPDTVIDCRTLWPPIVEGGEGGCGDCSVCVTAESHNSGQLTIQAAIDQVRLTGGTVCLGPGLYQLRAPISIAGARSVRLHGQGWTTVLFHLGAGPAIVVLGSIGVRIDDLTVVTSAVAPDRELADLAITAGTGMGIAIRNSLGVTVERCVVVQVGRLGGSTDVSVGTAGVLAAFLGRGGPAIALSGFVVQARIRENVLVAGSGVLALASDPFPDRERLAPVAPQLGIVATANLFVEDNLILGTLSGISLDGLCLHLAETRLSGNLVVSGLDGGIVARGWVWRAALGGFPSHLMVRGNTVRPAGDGIVVGAGDSRIVENDVSAVATQGDGIALVTGLQRTGVERCQVLANRVTGVRGNGIGIRGRVRSAMIKHNVVQVTGGGIVMDPKSEADDLDIEDNQLLDIEELRQDDEKVTVAAIRVTRAGRARIANNAIARVGRIGPQLSARTGIEVVACTSVAIAGNEVVDVGPTEFIGQGAGILVLAPFDRLDVVDNVVRRASDPPQDPDGAAWWGVLVRSVRGLRETPVVIGRIGLVSLENLAFLFDDDRLAALPRGREIVAVRGNLAEGHGLTPVVEVHSDGACVVSDNRCLLTSFRTHAVEVEAGALVAGGNYVQGSPDMPAARLAVPEGAYTVVGNVTSGRIEMPLSPTGGLEPPWEPINTVAF